MKFMKKRIIALLMVLTVFSTTASAFTFPTPDWGALLAEKTQMVSETDFELYVEGTAESAPYYGARLEPRGGTYFGMIAENSHFLPNVSSYLTYFDMDIRQTDMYYPSNNIIRAGDAVVTIGYTVNSLGNVDYNTIKTALDTLASYNKPMFIRFANEMNVSTLGDDPDLYIEVFRRVADMVHQYPNFAVVWSPNDMGALDRPFEYFYPGDEYVDWIGVSSYMKKYFQGKQDTADKDARYFMTGDYAWATNAVKPIIKFMQDNNINKPLMISEGGVATENKYGEDLEAWATPRLRNMYYNTIMKYPQIKLINYFNVLRISEAERYYVSDSQTAGATDKPYAMNILAEASACGAYIQQGNDVSEFVFEQAQKGSTLSSKNGIVNLYTLAHIPSTPNIEVNYTVDGAWYHSSRTAPYTCGLNISALADGEHTVQISSQGLSKSYTFYKSGDAIRFGAYPESVQPVTDNIKIIINGEELTIAADDTKPLIIDGRTLVPLRAIFNALDMSVQWNGETKTVTANGRGREILLTIGVNEIIVNGESKEIDVPAMLINNRTMVPARAVAQSLGCSVDWLGEERTVVIEG